MPAITIFSTGIPDVKIKSSTGEATFRFNTDEGDAEVIFPASTVLQLVPTLLAVYSKATSNSGEFKSFRIQELTIGRDKKNGELFLFLGIGGSRLAFEIHPTHLESLKVGIASLEGKETPKPHPGTAH